MKKLFIIANWKSNKTTSETKEWLQSMSDQQLTVSSDEKEVIIGSPYALLSLVKSTIEEKKLPIKVGSQDFSAFDPGAHTGEESPVLLKEFIQYTILGHSERRDDLGETDEFLAKKVANALKYGIQPVFCVQGAETPVPEGVTLVAYEPVFAIGTGVADTPENAERVIKEIKEKTKIPHVLYGGSVTGDNVHSFTQMPSIDGVLVGGASLDPKKFLDIINNS